MEKKVKKIKNKIQQKYQMNKQTKKIYILRIFQTIIKKVVMKKKEENKKIKKVVMKKKEENKKKN